MNPLVLHSAAVLITWMFAGSGPAIAAPPGDGADERPASSLQFGVDGLPAKVGAEQVAQATPEAVDPAGGGESAAAPGTGGGETPGSDYNWSFADYQFQSVEDELSAHPELGPRTMSDLSPQALEIRRAELIAQTRRVMPVIPPQARQFVYAWMGMMSPMSLRDMFNWFTYKVKAKKGLTVDEIIESMDIKANELNFKKVGHNEVWKDVAAITGQATTRVEVLSYCDAMVGRRMLDISPEFGVWIPCRITVYEDANGDVWIMTLDWDMRWLNTAWHPDSRLNEQLRQDGLRIRQAMEAIMQAGATGAW